jgi:aldehyde:ferredoxin oxidoreductase
MFKIIRVNMPNLSVKKEDVSEAYQGLGGRGLTSAILLGEVEPTCSPIIDKEKQELTPADDLKGIGNYGTIDKLKNEFNEKVGFVSIGPAGEWKLGAASVAYTDKEVRQGSQSNYH